AGGRNLAIHASAAGLSNNWVYVAADLVNDDTGTVDSIDFDLEHYSGVDDGESWSEGDYENTVYIGPTEKGRYILRVETQHPRDKPAPEVDVDVREGVFHATPFVIGAVLLLALPLCLGLYKLSFEKRRWENSDYPKFSSGDE